MRMSTAKLDNESDCCDRIAEKIESSNYRMGLASWRPRYLQKFNSIKIFVFTLSAVSAIQGVVVNGLIAVSIQPIGKEFGFPNKVTGAILAANHAGGLLVVTFVSFFGSKGSKPKWIAVGSTISGFGAFLFAVPKLLSGQFTPGQFNQTNLEICSFNDNITLNRRLAMDCGLSGGKLLNAVIFIVSQVIMGAGMAPLQTLGPTYLDENSAPRDSPIYLGIWLISVLWGPWLGFVVGTGFLNIYTDFRVKNANSISVEDTTWVGAWWLGFVALSGFFVSVGVFILLFPKQMKRGRLEREKALQNGELPSSDNTLRYTFKGYVSECIKLCSNKVFMLSSFAVTLKSFYYVALLGFLLKFLVLKFDISEVKGGAMVGVSLLISIAGGVMAGSHLMRKSKVNTSGKSGALLCSIISLLGITNVCAFFIPGCQNTNLAGVVVPYHGRNMSVSLMSSCNINCSCTVDKYLPVCGSDGITYYSPCFAGCTEMLDSVNDTKIFGNCACIPTLPKTLPFQGSVENEAAHGKCDSDCKNFYLFITICVVGLIISFLSETPHTLMVLRSVANNKGSFALGMQFLLTRSLCFLPAPLFIGAVLDVDCIAWSYNSCGEKNKCLDYNLDRLSIKFVLLGTIAAAIASMLYILGWWLYPTKKGDEKPILSESNEDNSFL